MRISAPSIMWEKRKHPARFLARSPRWWYGVLSDLPLLETKSSHFQETSVCLGRKRKRPDHRSELHPCHRRRLVPVVASQARAVPSQVLPAKLQQNRQERDHQEDILLEKIKEKLRGNLQALVFLRVYPLWLRLPTHSLRRRTTKRQLGRVVEVVRRGRQGRLFLAAAERILHLRVAPLKQNRETSPSQSPMMRVKMMKTEVEALRGTEEDGTAAMVKPTGGSTNIRGK